MPTPTSQTACRDVRDLAPVTPAHRLTLCSVLQTVPTCNALDGPLGTKVPPPFAPAAVPLQSYNLLQASWDGDTQPAVPAAPDNTTPISPGLKAYNPFSVSQCGELSGAIHAHANAAYDPTPPGGGHPGALASPCPGQNNAQPLASGLAPPPTWVPFDGTVTPAATPVATECTGGAGAAGARADNALPPAWRGLLVHPAPPSAGERTYLAGQLVPAPGTMKLRKAPPKPHPIVLPPCPFSGLNHVR